MPISTKSTYRQLCTEKELPLFLQDWWMDAVCGPDNWDVCLSVNTGRIVGALPFLLRKKLFFKLIIPPQLTQFNGVWIDYTYGMHEDEKSHFESVVVADLLNQIAQRGFDYYNQNWQYHFHNEDIIHQKGFDTEKRFTYVIEDISNPESVFEAFSYAKQKHIKKSEAVLFPVFDMTADDFYAFHAECLSEKVLYSKALFLSLFESCMQRQSGQIIAVKDKDENIHAALFVVWDKHSAYNLISAIDPNYKSSGASTLVVWEAIQYMSNKTKIFDFEGSMIESVANSFKQFGTVRKTYFNVSKINSSVFKFLMQLRPKK